MRFFGHERADLSSDLRCNESNNRKTGYKRENKTWKSYFRIYLIIFPSQDNLRSVLRLFVIDFLPSFWLFRVWESNREEMQIERELFTRPRDSFGGGRLFVTEDFVLELISVESYGRVKVNWSFELIVLFQIVFLIRICSNVNRGIKYKIERKLLNLDNLKKKFDKRIS